MNEHGLGCILEPGEPNGLSAYSALGIGGAAVGVELPKTYVAKGFEKWFNFNADGIVTTNPSEMKIKDQKTRPSCVGQSSAYQKGAIEGKEISARDVYRQAKRLDGYGDPLSWGTTLGAGQDAMVNGAADELLVPEPDGSWDIGRYVDLADVTDAVKQSRDENKSKSSFYVYRYDFKETLVKTQTAIVTSCMWYSSDSAIGYDGLMQMPTGSQQGGHAFVIVGWGYRIVNGQPIEVLIAPNSWGKEWGDNGVFYIPVKDVSNRLSAGYVTVDMPPDLAKILTKYDGHDVQVIGDPKIWRITDGKKRHYPDEICFWAHGGLFGFSVVEIRQQDLDAIPDGEPMKIDEAPWQTRELVRQIRQHYGKL